MLITKEDADAVEAIVLLLCFCYFCFFFKKKSIFVFHYSKLMRTFVC